VKVRVFLFCASLCLAACTDEPAPAPASPTPSPATSPAPPLGPPTSPEAVFQIVKRSSENKDFAAFYRVLTPRSQEAQTRVALLSAATLVLDSTGPHALKSRGRFIKLSRRYEPRLEKAIPNDEQVRTARACLHSYVDATKEQGKSPPAQLFAELSEIVADLQPGSALTFESLEELKREGESASGVFVLTDAQGKPERQLARFQQVGDEWRLDFGQ
jgi:hypothetical protein